MCKKMTNLNDVFEEAAEFMQTPAKKAPENPKEVGLSTKKLLITDKEFLQYINTALMKYLDYHITDVPKFSKTLKAYLLHLGIVSERSFKIFYSFDPPPNTLGRTTSDGKVEQLDTSLISLTICKGLEKLSQIVNVTTKESYFMEDAKKIKLAKE